MRRGTTNSYGWASNEKEVATIRDDIRLVISEWLIRFACSLRECKSGSLEWLQMLGKEQQPKHYDTTRKTDNIEFVLFEIAYFTYNPSPHKDI